MNISIDRSPADTVTKLKEQLYFLNESCKGYDNGYKHEVQRIATCIRILLVENKKSLLTQLNVKNTIQFLDTTHPYFELPGLKPLLPSYGLVDIGPPVKAFLNSYPDQYKKKSFDDWWHQIVLDDTSNKFTRGNLIHLVADKDGGCHVDPKLPPEYHALKNNSMAISANFKITTGFGDTEIPLNNFDSESIRQIGFEVIKTLETDEALKKLLASI